MKNLTLFLIVTVGILAVAELASILTTTSPHGAAKDVMWAFFISLFLSLFSILSLTWYAVKRFLIYRFSSPSLTPCVRQAGLFSLVIVLCLFFSSLGILSIWDSVPLILSTLLIEFFFQADTSARTNPRHELS